jgi:CRISPR-associated endonuclease/helicase Cas3
MNILLISQCHKNALKETRRILDQFAERCGERTWQTTMTQAGLATLHKLLRQTARRNTAVACYWTHGKNLTELLWIVGDQRQFNALGRVPTNRTKRNILRADDENPWRQAASIQILATLAALLHDLGKATVGFQNKLTTKDHCTADPYRHEWLSLHIFRLMIADCDSNQACLQRLADFGNYRSERPDWLKPLAQGDHLDFSSVPPIGQMIGWLIVSHHRMPFTKLYKQNQFKAERKEEYRVGGYSLSEFFQFELRAVDRWLKNQAQQYSPSELRSFWQLKQDVTQSQSWQKQLSRWATKALNHAPLMTMAQTLISDPFLFHLTRLSLMVGDHNYSSLDKDDKREVSGDEAIAVIANTDRKSGRPKQRLDEHLIGVAQFTARFSRLLPILAQRLPALQRNRAFSRRTRLDRFRWQDKSFDLVKSIQPAAQSQGFFGVNMASTGCGKTLANARIMYGLADAEKGARFTIALGLRVLTLQTGRALQEKLDLNDEQLATLIGGQAAGTLFTLREEDGETPTSDNNHGSESTDALVDGLVTDDGAIFDQQLGTVIADKKARRLLYTPVVACTIDHLASASENKRGGKHIVPLLRLLSADLILDEPDDFNQEDLPALARLVHLTGMLGGKILLSSATLTPDLVTGLFDAYRAGRCLWQRQNGLAEKEIICGWFDEFKQSLAECQDKAAFIAAHERFTATRVERLECEPTRRKAVVMAIDVPAKRENEQFPYYSLAEQLLHQAYRLHRQHSTPLSCQEKSVSLGLIRMAHTTDLIPTVQAMQQVQALSADTHYHICCYHARQLLILRSALENKLDRILNRTTPERLFEQPEIIAAINSSPAKNHIFIVAATPVAEIGRDHDYDWAIVEPSSMRSIIQLAGRVGRHRPTKTVTAPNIAIMHSNIDALKESKTLAKGKAYFLRPGFEESPDFLLDHHDIALLMPEEQLSVINSIARIQKPTELRPKERLADLEHAVMQHLFNPAEVNYISAYWQPQLAHHACVHLPIISPFRYQERPKEEYVCQLTQDDSNGGFSFSLAEKAWLTPHEVSPDTRNSYIVYQPDDATANPNVSRWLGGSLLDELSDLAEKLGEDNLHRVAIKYATVSLDKLRSNQSGRWYFHPEFGFWWEQ